MTIWFANAKTPPHQPAVIFGGRFFLLLVWMVWYSMVWYGMAWYGTSVLAIVGKYLFLTDYAFHSAMSFDMCRSHGECFCLKLLQLRFQI